MFIEKGYKGGAAKAFGLRETINLKLLIENQEMQRKKNITSRLLLESRKMHENKFIVPPFVYSVISIMDHDLNSANYSQSIISASLLTAF